MDTTTLFISSSSTSNDITLQTSELDDKTRVVIDIMGIPEISLPLYLKIDWGDGEIETFDSNNIIPANGVVNPLKFSPLLSNTYSHDYIPSSNCMYKTLTGQLLIEFTNGDLTWCKFPIEIRNKDYFESIGDILLHNIKIIDTEDNQKEYQFVTEVDQRLIELQGN